MRAAPSNRMLVLLENDKRTRAFPIQEGILTVGRDPDNDIVLPHSSVSRQHARLVSGEGQLAITDLKSRNGIHVNGVPRTEAVLQNGDKVRIGHFTFEVAPNAPSDMPSLALKQGLEKAIRVDQTLEQSVQLPDEPHERQLVTLYHICFWIAEGIEEKDFNNRCLELIREAFRASEAHLYSATQSLEAFALESGRKPAVKLAAFLATQFQEASEAICIHGQDIARHQRGIGEFNYLVAPLRSPQTETREHPFLVIVRPDAQTGFSTEDRVLLQAICQLWVRGLGKTNQLLQLRHENAKLKGKSGNSGLIGSSSAIQAQREQASRAARTNISILITGESGSGKEVFAQFIHDQSPRKEGPLVKLNCAAIPDSLIESELFGYVKGAFSGAVRDHQGKFVQADKGTLFLDEIGEMPLLVQAKVLRAIENREVTPLGSAETLKADIRIIAATNRDLKELVQEKLFREDLYYRLDVQKIRVLPLRDHLEDIDELAGYFLNRFCADNGLADMKFNPEAIAALKQHPWPGNVRELWNVVQRCALAADSSTITAPNVTALLNP